MPFFDLTDDQWTRLVDVNHRGPWLCSQVFCRKVIGEKRKGSIVPVMLRTCEPAAIHLRLGTIQFIDFRRDPESSGGQLLAWLRGRRFHPLVCNDHSLGETSRSLPSGYRQSETGVP